MRAEESEKISNSNDLISSKDDDDGFTMVKSKSKKTKFTPLNNKINVTSTNTSCVLDKDVKELNARIQVLKLKLKDCDQYYYWSKLQLVMTNIIKCYFNEKKPSSLNNKKNVNSRKINIFCYGLGSIDNEFSSRYQFALLLLIIDELKSISFDSDTGGMNGLQINIVELYDPVFNEIDKKLLNDVYSFKLESINCKCMKNTSSLDEITNKMPDDEVLNFFYMPHCSKGLFNNLLFANWSEKNLNSLIILGNSFDTIMLNTLDQLLVKNYSFIRDSRLFLQEVKLDNRCDLTDAFYDMSFLTFKVNSNEIVKLNLINKLDSNNLVEPCYDENIEEIF